jgi:hypothetical protein
MWQADSDATRSSSGFQRWGSPLNTGSEDPGIVGLPGAESSCARAYDRYVDVPDPVLPVQANVVTYL